MNILGISAFYHDSAAALIRDGEIVAAAQEERFSRKKHDPGFPFHAVRYCISEARRRGESVDAVAFYDKPIRKFERILKTYFAMYKNGNASTEDFIDVAEKVSGKDLDGFFDLWLYDERLPPIPEMGLGE